MADPKFIEHQLNLLIQLCDRTAGYQKSCYQFASSSRPELEKQWYSTVANALDYSLILMRCFKNDTELHPKLEEERFGYVVGKISVTSFLEVINRFEQFLQKIINGRNHLKDLIIQNLKGKKNKKSLMQKVSIIRNILLKEEIINQTDFDILQFSFTIRNCIHNNFVATKNINFEYPDIRTGKIYYYRYSKGDELHHPGDDLLGYFSLTEQLVFILVCIIQRTEYVI